MKSGIWALIFAVVAVVSANWTPAPAPEPSPVDPVVLAMQVYEQLWRETAALTAEKLRAGELETDADTWKFIADRNRAAREAAFGAIAEAEQAALAEWSPEKHAALLESYAGKSGE